MSAPNTWAWRFVQREPVTGKADFGAIWIINAPWAHPFWPQYQATLCDLTTNVEAAPPTILLPGATHEFLLWAIDPDKPRFPERRPDDMAAFLALKPYGHLLQPANYGYQFRAASDDAALARIQAAIDAIVAGDLSPDTDFRSSWNKMWQDAYPLVQTNPALLAALSRGTGTNT